MDISFVIGIFSLIITIASYFIEVEEKIRVKIKVFASATVSIYIILFIFACISPSPPAPHINVGNGNNFFVDIYGDVNIENENKTEENENPDENKTPEEGLFGNSKPVDSSIPSLENLPYELDIEIFFKYEQVPEYSITAKNIDTGAIKALGSSNKDNQFSGFFSAGTYLISIETQFGPIATPSIYKTGDGNSDNPYLQRWVEFIDFTPLGGNLSTEIFDFEIKLRNGKDTDNLYLFLEQPSFTKKSSYCFTEEDEYQINTIDIEKSTAHLVMDRSYDKLYMLFYGILGGENYYGVSSSINDDGVLLIELDTLSQFN